MRLWFNKYGLICCKCYFYVMWLLLFVQYHILQRWPSYLNSPFTGQLSVPRPLRSKYCFHSRRTSALPAAASSPPWFDQISWHHLCGGQRPHQSLRTWPIQMMAPGGINGFIVDCDTDGSENKENDKIVYELAPHMGAQCQTETNAQIKSLQG